MVVVMVVEVVVIVMSLHVMYNRAHTYICVNSIITTCKLLAG